MHFGVVGGLQLCCPRVSWGAGVGVRSVGSAGIPFDAVVESAVERAFDAVDEPLTPGAALSFTPLWSPLALCLLICRYCGIILLTLVRYLDR